MSSDPILQIFESNDSLGKGHIVQVATLQPGVRRTILFLRKYLFLKNTTSFLSDWGCFKLESHEIVLFLKLRAMVVSRERDLAIRNRSTLISASIFTSKLLHSKELASYYHP